MSESKYRYYQVVQTSVVKANNQTDAIALATSRRRNGVAGEVVSTETVGLRITAVDAHAATATV